MSHLRSLLGPLMLGLAAWCAAGAVTLAGPDLLADRLVVPASPLWGLAVFALAACWPVCRRYPRAAAPSLLALLPWIPAPWPAGVWLWTGGLAWAPVVLAVCVLLWREWAPVREETWGERDGRAGVGPWLAGAAAVVALGLTAWGLAPRLPGGDEPHYLIITQSLLLDGDLKIENNHAARDYAAYFGGRMDPDFLRRGRDEVIYSIHAPGLPTLIAPAFAVAGYRGAQATVIAVAALAAALVWWAGWTAARDRGAAWVAWAAVVGSTTFLVQGVTIFPDGPAALIVAWATVVLLRLERRELVPTRTLVGLSATLAFLPFLHTRLAAVAVGLAVPILWACLRDTGRSSRSRVIRGLAFVAIPACGVVAWLAYFYALYGTPNPSIPYGTNPDTRAAFIPGGVAGVLIDQQFGLMAFAPVLALAIAGWFARRSDDHAGGRALLPAVALYLGAVGSYWMWWAGRPATPARFAAAILPALAPPIAVLWRRSGRALRVASTALLALSIAITVVVLATDRGGLAWNTYDAHAAWLQGVASVANLPRAWPSFFWDLTPGQVSSEWPFAAHLLAWLGVIAATIVAVRWLGRRGCASAGAWAVALCAMVGAEGSWMLLGVPGIDPAASQLRALRSVAAGQPLFLLPLGGVGAREAPTSALAIDVPRAGLARASSPEWAALSRVPAGVYELRVASRRPQPGRLTIRLREGAPLRTLDLDGQTEQRVELALPAGAEMLGFEPEEGMAAAGRRLTLRPLRLIDDRGPLARSVWAAPSSDVFFLDSGVYLEADGFWVKGGEAAQLVIAARVTTSRVMVRLTNGGLANTVVVTTAGGDEPLALNAGESRQVAVRLDAQGRAKVRLSSVSGFTPAKVSGSADGRFLGVRVSVDP